MGGGGPLAPPRPWREADVTVLGQPSLFSRIMLFTDKCCEHYRHIQEYLSNLLAQSRTPELEI